MQTFRNAAGGVCSVIPGWREELQDVVIRHVQLTCDRSPGSTVETAWMSGPFTARVEDQAGD